jgi:hypothetical protein
MAEDRHGGVVCRDVISRRRCGAYEVRVRGLAPSETEQVTPKLLWG